LIANLLFDMRTLLTGLLLLLSTTTGSMAQRPWIRAISPDVEAPPRLAVAANSLVAYRDVMSTSIDQGVNWTRHGQIPANVVGVTDFFSNVSLCASQAAKGDSVDIYFTQGGTSWSFSERLDIGDRQLVELESLGQTFYLVNNGGTIVARSTSIRELTVPIQSGSSLIDLECSQDLFAVLTSEGVFLSTDKGETWSKQHPTIDDVPRTVFNLMFRDGALIASSDLGVLTYEPASTTWTPLGTWEGMLEPPVVRAVAADNQRIITLAETSEGRLQMYRLDAGDTTWMPTAYELPLDQPQTDRDLLVIDAGWAVTYVSSTVDADSTGLYRYNLNDFTSVQDSPLPPGVVVRTTSAGLYLEHPDMEGGLVELVDLTGRSVFERTFRSTPIDLSLPDHLRGLFGVVVRWNGRTPARTVIQR